MREKGSIKLKYNSDGLRPLINAARMSSLWKEIKDGLKASQMKRKMERKVDERKVYSKKVDFLFKLVILKKW